MVIQALEIMNSFLLKLQLGLYFMQALSHIEQAGAKITIVIIGDSATIK